MFLLLLGFFFFFKCSFCYWILVVFLLGSSRNELECMYFVIVAGFLLKQSVLAAFLSDFLQQKENISFLVFFF